MQTHSQNALITPVTATKNQLASLLTILEEVPDPRVTTTVDHALPDILTIALRTILCGGQNFYDMEAFGQVRLGLVEDLSCPAPWRAHARHL